MRGATLEAVKQQYAIVFRSIILARLPKRATSQEPSPTVRICNLHCCRQPPMRWHATAAAQGVDREWPWRQHRTAAVFYSAAAGLQKKDYVVYIYGGAGPADGQTMPAAAAPSKPGVDGHAGEVEIAGAIMAARRHWLIRRERGRIRSGSKASGVSSGAQHGYLVVCQLSQSLCWRRGWGDSRPGGGPARNPSAEGIRKRLHA